MCIDESLKSSHMEVQDVQGGFECMHGCTASVVESPALQGQEGSTVHVICKHLRGWINVRVDDK